MSTLNTAKGHAFFLVGPTSVGKSSVAHYLGLQHTLPIVSLDSMQVYRGLDIGTAKATALERSEVTYFGLDLIEVSEAYDLKQYTNYVTQQTASDQPLICAGGTGLYVNALVNGVNAEELSDPVLRTELEALSVPELQLRLGDSGVKELSDPQNPRRLIRAIERKEGELKESVWEVQKPKVVVLRMEREALVTRIKSRMEEMFSSGWIEETEAMMHAFPVWSETALQAIGYKEIRAHIEGELSLDVCKEKVFIRTRQYAKRQMTWFRNKLDAHWIDVDASSSVESVAADVWEAWLETGGQPFKS